MPTPGEPRRSTDAIRRALLGLESLPIRPDSARSILDRGGRPEPSMGLALDPALALAVFRGRAVGPRLVARSPWWPPGFAAVERLWRHSAAISREARRLAEATSRDDLDPARFEALGLLTHLGLWAIAAEAPEALGELLDLPDGPARSAQARRRVGIDPGNLGRALATRWGCDPMLVAIAWRGPNPNFGPEPSAPLRLLKDAYRAAQATPWFLGPEPLETDATGPLVARVQALCGGGIAPVDSGPREAHRAREHAKALIRNRNLRRQESRRTRILSEIANPEASGASTRNGGNGRVPGVVPTPASPVTSTPTGVGTTPVTRPERDAEVPGSSLHRQRLRSRDPSRLDLDAWAAHHEILEERDRLARLVELLHLSLERQGGTGPPASDRAVRDRLAEFAAGAGHELNNPLAVIQGRAQLLQARTADPAALRSLRAIVQQAQRAHQILRDLMYYARPPAPQPRLCRPLEVARSAVADLGSEADAVGVQLVGRVEGASIWAEAEPETIRHVLEVLVRNAIRVTPAGGVVTVVGRARRGVASWSVEDDGPGLRPEEASRMFDPFYCGRQAGRGVGLGLPRARRALERLGGRLDWHPRAGGRGTTFVASFPCEPVAEPNAADAA